MHTVFRGNIFCLLGVGVRSEGGALIFFVFRLTGNGDGEGIVSLDASIRGSSPEMDRGQLPKSGIDELLSSFDALRK